MELRPYQKNCKAALIAALVKDGKCLAKLPCGAGKTVIFCSLIKDIKDHGANCLIIVQKNILIEQTEKELYPWIGKVAIYNAGVGKKEIGQITLASIQSIAKYEGDLNFRNLIADEIHRFAIDNESSQITQLIDKIKPKNVMAFSATPFNIDYFQNISYEIGLETLVNQGYLSPIKYIGQKNKDKINLAGVKLVKGDYVESQLQNCVLKNKDKIFAQVEDAISKSTDRRKIMVITTGIDHCEYVHSLLPDSQILHSKRKDQKHQLDRWKESGRILVSVIIPSEGFNFPPADCLWFFRPTKSPTLYLQAAGRILRKYDGKEYGLFLDYGNVVNTLGHIYNVDDPKKKKPAQEKICYNCEAYNHPHRKTCWSCDTKFLRSCQACLNWIPTGLNVCIHCGEDQTVERDSIKNTTLSAYGTDEEKKHIVNVWHVNFAEMTDKNSKHMLRIRLVTSEGTRIVFIGHWHENRFELYRQNIKIGVDIEMKKKNKYWKIERVL